MKKLSALLENRNVIFLLAIAGGLLAHQGAKWTEALVIPGLAVVMTISTLGIPNDVFHSPRALIGPALKGILMNYLILAPFIIALSTIMISDEALRTGFILVAAAPPAVAVIPFANILEGDEALALIGTVGAYLGALIIMPVMTLSLLGTSFLEPWKLATIMLELIILPLLISRLLLLKGWHKAVARPGHLLTNWSFFIVLYTIVGLNRTALVKQPSAIIPVGLITVLGLFLLGYLIERIGRFYHLSEATRTSLTLLGTLKNYGLSGGLALTFFNREASLPSAVGSIFLILYVVWLDFQKKRQNKAVPK